MLLDLFFFPFRNTKDHTINLFPLILLNCAVLCFRSGHKESSKYVHV